MGERSKSARFSFCPLNCFVLLIVSQVSCACVLTAVANVFDVRFLGHAVLLSWIAFSGIFLLMGKGHVRLRIVISVGACVASLIICLLLHYVYRIIA